MKQSSPRPDSKDKKQFHLAFLHPKYWGIWLVFALFLPLMYLPLAWQFFLGRAIGRLSFKLGHSRRNVTLVNLTLAFPSLSDQARDEMAKEVFINQGIGIFETLCAWFRPHIFDRCQLDVDGIEHVVTAQKQGKAILMLGGHYTMLDLGGLFCHRFFEADCVYRPQNNPVLEWFISNRRYDIFGNQIAHVDVRTLIKRLKKGGIVWYTPDQDFGLKSGVMAEFFGVPCATVTAPRRLANIGDKTNLPAVMGLHFYRTSSAMLKFGELPSYQIRITPALENYPSDDEMADAVRINQQLERFIRTAPTQWMWFHKRYKTAEQGRSHYYD